MCRKIDQRRDEANKNMADRSLLKERERESCKAIGLSIEISKRFYLMLGGRGKETRRKEKKKSERPEPNQRVAVSIRSEQNRDVTLTENLLCRDNREANR